LITSFSNTFYAKGIDSQPRNLAKAVMRLTEFWSVRDSNCT